MAEVGKEGRKGTIEGPGRSRRTEETKRPLKTENPIDYGKCTRWIIFLLSHGPNPVYIVFYFEITELTSQEELLKKKSILRLNLRTLTILLLAVLKRYC